MDMNDALSLSALAEGSEFVGGIIDMDFQSCIVETNDRIKSECGGLAKHTFLIARMENEVAEGGQTLDDIRNHAVLLRVTGTATHPEQEQLYHSRHQDMEERIVGEVRGPESAHDLDPVTKSQLQKTAVKAEVLGTFYQNDDDSISFGSDLHTAFPSGAYMVYKPRGETLSQVASFVQDNASEEETVQQVKLGTVQYAATELRKNSVEAAMYMNVDDLVGESDGKKTAVLGMTRTGKSNMLKILAVATHAELNEEVGQLIFDPSGEYARPSAQDEVALGNLHEHHPDVSEDEITVFKYKSDENNDTEPLGVNLLKPNNIRTARREAEKQIQMRRGGGMPDYADNFINGSRKIRPPEEINETEDRALAASNSKRAGAFIGVLLNGGLEPIGPAHDFSGENGWSQTFTTNSDIRETAVTNSSALTFRDAPNDAEEKKQLYYEFDNRHQITNEQEVGKLYERGRLYIYDTDAMTEFWQSYAEHRDDHDDRDDEMNKILDLLAPEQGGAGVNLLNELDRVHSTSTDRRATDRVYDRLEEGNLVIIDTQNGSRDILSYFSDRIVEGVLEESESRFNQVENDDHLPKIQIFLEEAHRNFNKDRFDDNDKEDIYVRLAKEGAKFQIGVVYATQEVTSVESEVLANTKNWIVTHLNNDDEIQELSKYYDFDAFEHRIKNVDKVGFSRVRTETSKFTVPVQIHEFDKEFVENLEVTTQSARSDVVTDDTESSANTASGFSDSEQGDGIFDDMEES